MSLNCVQTQRFIYHLREFKVRCGSRCDYEEILQLRSQANRTQLVHFRSSTTQKMRSTLLHANGVPDDDDTVDRCSHPFSHQGTSPTATEHRPPTDALRGASSKRKVSPLITLFVTLKELTEDDELCEQRLHTLLVTRIISGIRDQETREKPRALHQKCQQV